MLLDPLTAHSVPVMCDWTTGCHRYLEPVKPFESGKVLKLDRDGAIEWEKRDWNTIRCASSDTSLRFSCDGERLRFSGNIGRFQHADNTNGSDVVSCIDRWAEVFTPMDIDLTMFGSISHQGKAYEAGTTLSRIDLAGNFETDNYLAWCQVLMQKRLGRRLPEMGKYGPLWGKTAKRSNWWKAKVYDKSAELANRRAAGNGATLARFEVQLGGEYLKREGLQYVAAWKDQTVAQIIYGRFAAQLLSENADVETWDDIPPKLRQYAILWRDGQNVRQYFAHDSSYCRIKSKLRDFGIDLDIPCNVVALSRRVKQVIISPVSALRAA